VGYNCYRAVFPGMGQKNKTKTHKMMNIQWKNEKEIMK